MLERTRELPTQAVSANPVAREGRRHELGRGGDLGAAKPSQHPVPARSLQEFERRHSHGLLPMASTIAVNRAQLVDAQARLNTLRAVARWHRLSSRWFASGHWPLAIPLSAWLFDGSDFQQLQSEGPEAIDDPVKGGLIDLLGSESGVAGLQDHIELLKGGDDGRHRFTGEGDLICPCVSSTYRFSGCWPSPLSACGSERPLSSPARG